MLAGSGYTFMPLTASGPNGGRTAPSSPSATSVIVRTKESPTFKSFSPALHSSLMERLVTGSQLSRSSAPAGLSLTSMVIPSINAVTLLVFKFLNTKLLEPSVTSPLNKISGISRGPLR